MPAAGENVPAVLLFHVSVGSDHQSSGWEAKVGFPSPSRIIFSLGILSRRYLYFSYSNQMQSTS